ncbi:Major facilitator superfamily protein [Euphorbia peplus]|nr:Major facilitator superfamily protein [Euphorbia peplus]
MDSDVMMKIKEPLILSNPPKAKGGFRALPFIIGCSALEKIANIGVMTNMIVYLTKEYRIEAAEGANLLFLWSAATNFTPLMGAFVADSYLGRFSAIAFGSLLSLLGLIVLWLTSVIPEAKPGPCISERSCESATSLQLLLLYSSFVLIAIGGGGVRSSCMAFGADQIITRKQTGGSGILESYFSWYYVIISVSLIIAMTLVVYIQDMMGWKVGFGVSVVLMFLSCLCFFLASPFYVKSQVHASLLTGFAQVFLAACRRRSVSVSSSQLYFTTKASSLVAPTQKLRFLNKACIIKDPEQDLTPCGRASDPWSLCTVEQVEDVKALIKIIPIWSSGMFMSITVSQSSFQVLQASTMNRHIFSNFEIPAGSLSAFLVISLVIWVTLYDRIIIPVSSKLKGKPVRLSLKQKMGIGILFSISSMAALAVAERIRRGTAVQEGFSDNPDGVVDMSVMWLLPHLFLGGIAEGFNAIAQNEFYYSELPKSMSTVATSLFEMGMSAANLVASVIMSAVDSMSRRGGQESWVATNINKGHYDYYCWLLASMSMANFVYYVFCSKAYGPCRGEVDHNVLDDITTSDDC